MYDVLFVDAGVWIYCGRQGALLAALPPPPPTFPSLSVSLVQADEPVDIKEQLEKVCHKPCANEFKLYEKCVDRVKAKGSGQCEPWSFDYIHCVDKCVRYFFVVFVWFGGVGCLL